jgi:hypothetical protein
MCGAGGDSSGSDARLKIARIKKPQTGEICGVSPNRLKGSSELYVQTVGKIKNVGG